MNVSEYILRSTWDVKCDETLDCVSATKGEVSLDFMYESLSITHSDGYIDSCFEFLEEDIKTLKLSRDKLELTTYGGIRLAIPTHIKNDNDVKLPSCDAQN